MKIIDPVPVTQLEKKLLLKNELNPIVYHSSEYIIFKIGNTITIMWTSMTPIGIANGYQ